ncbi:MAG: SDR family NAD(P)-dependent oxidoreductase [Devosia sp.]|nr:SDR family NAD(P)-dependent oxidoreductase [Devosia sp.]
MAESRPVVITGASSGIGRAAALRLARRNLPVVMVCREGAKARAVHAEIVRLTGNRTVELETADLSSMAEVRRVAQSIRNKHPGIGALINNAGAAFRDRRISVDGIELTFAINHLAPFLLTNLLLDRLKAGAPSRVVTVSSDLQRPLHLDDLDRHKSYDGLHVYAETKLANLLFTFELARQLKGTKVTANALAPGFLRTAIMRNADARTRALMLVLRLVMMEPAERGGDRIVYAATSPDLAGVSGEFLVKNQPAKASAQAYDTALAVQLWAISERLTGLAPGPGPGMPARPQPPLEAGE